MNWDNDIMYWSANPQDKLLFGEIYKTDTSRDKKKSSAYMWGLALIYHLESKIFDWTLKAKIDYVSSHVWKDYSKEFLTTHKDDGIVMSSLDGGDSPGIRQLKEWSRIMDEKSEFLSRQTYDKDSWVMIEDMLASNSKLFKEYERINTIILAEKTATDTTVGKSEESMLEKGDLSRDDQ